MFGLLKYETAHSTDFALRTVDFGLVYQNIVYNAAMIPSISTIPTVKDGEVRNMDASISIVLLFF